MVCMKVFMAGIWEGIVWHTFLNHRHRTFDYFMATNMLKDCFYMCILSGWNVGSFVLKASVYFFFKDSNIILLSGIICHLIMEI